MTRLCDLKEGDEFFLKLKKRGCIAGCYYAAENSKGNETYFHSNTDVIKIEPKIKVPKKVAEILNEKQLVDLIEQLKNYYDHPKHEALWEFLENETDNFYEQIVILAELKLNGFEVEDAQLGILLVDMPAPKFCDYYFLSTISADYKVEDYYSISVTSSVKNLKDKAVKVTEKEAKEKYPQFRWVSLEDLESSERE